MSHRFGVDPGLREFDVYGLDLERQYQRPREVLWHPEVLLSQVQAIQAKGLDLRPALHQAEGVSFSGAPPHRSSTVVDAPQAWDVSDHSAGGGPKTKAKGGSDKNRQAQKRYRERQKEKMEHYEKQVADLTAKVKELMKEKVSLESRNTLLEKVVKLKAADSADSGDSGTSGPENNFYTALANYYNVTFEGRRHFTLEDTQKIGTSSDVVGMDKEFARQLAICLVDAEKDPSSMAAKRLNELVHAFREMVFQLASQNAKAVALYIINLKKWSPDLKTWREVSASLQLSEEQKQRLLEARKRLFRQMGELIEERKSIFAQLQRAMHQGQEDFGSGELLEDGYSNHLYHATHASEELHKTLEEENTAVGLFVSEFFSHDLLDPIQQARLSVAAAPCMTDALAIVNLIAQEDDAASPSTDRLMQEMSEALQGDQGAESILPMDSAFRVMLSRR